MPFRTPTSIVAGTVDRSPLPEHEMLTPTEATVAFPFDNSYARPPERLFARLPPTPVAAPRLIQLNEALARHLRLDPEKSMWVHPSDFHADGVRSSVTGVERGNLRDGSENS